MTALLRVELPMKLPSAGNLHEHWRARHARIKAQRAAVKLALFLKLDLDVHALVLRDEPLACTLTRISPRKLDSDNLAFAFKGVRDQVAEELGIDDGSDAVEWLYAQESGPAGIRIEISREAKP